MGKVRRVLQVAGWGTTAALWSRELSDWLTSARGLNPCLDSLLDTLTATFTLGMVIWVLRDRVARLHSEREELRDRRFHAVFGRIDEACQKAGVPARSLESTQPIPAVYLVRDDRETG